ncbi:hypothetical protein [Dongia sp.]|uniref:hypothetical protein n=1 Tax=Dongia sp. TaxID=1977262 RepID=UPI00375174FB
MEVNPRHGICADQVPRQKAANQGGVRHGVVTVAQDGFANPAAEAVLRVTTTPVG